MSAGTGNDPTKVSRDLDLLAPRFRAAVNKAIAECNAVGLALEAMIYEAYRNNELQQIYYARGRNVIPPTKPVTNAPDNLYSWHGYGLAVDVVHKTKFWDVGEDWFKNVADVFKKHGCAWGGDWKARDLPHMQWGRCKPSPSDAARELVHRSGIESVWLAVGASDPVVPSDALIS